jgi:nuclease HARBI1
MRLPSTITVNRVTVSAIEGLAMMLKKLNYPCRLYDVSLEFGRNISSTGRIINHMLLLVYNKYQQHLKLWPGVTPARVAAYADAVTRFNPAIIDIWSFLDGTHRDIARPELQQRTVYNGKDRTHQLKYQLVLAPDGLFVSCCGPFVGTWHDVHILHDSQLQPALQPIVVGPQRTYMIYGDAAYQGQPLVLPPYVDPPVGSPFARVNAAFSSLRVRIENNFATMNNHWCATMLKKSQRSGLQPVALYFFVAVLFTNIHTCMNGTNVPFDINPPTVQRYLR